MGINDLTIYPCEVCDGEQKATKTIFYTTRDFDGHRHEYSQKMCRICPECLDEFLNNYFPVFLQNKGLGEGK